MFNPVHLGVTRFRNQKYPLKNFWWKIQNFRIIIKVLQRAFKGFRRLWVGNLIKAFRFFRFFGLIEFEIFRFKNKRDSCKFNLFFNSMIVVLWPVKIRNFIEDLIFHLKIVNWRWMKNNFHHSVCCVGGREWWGALVAHQIITARAPLLFE